MESRRSPRPKGQRRAVRASGWALVGALGVVVLSNLTFVGSLEAAPPQVAGATYVGSDTCKGCHADIAEKMERSLHGKLLGTNLSKGALQAQGCEGCHGPGSKHMENPADPVGNLRFGGKGKKSNLTPAGQNAVCLQCHSKGKQMLWAGSPHEARDVTCATCHTVHGPASRKHQLKVVKFEQFDSRSQHLDAVEYDLCGQCHQVKTFQFSRSSHMPLAARGEGGKITCSSCHNPHGTTTEKLIAAVSINANCTSCHAGKRGPFLWEHPPVLENCLSCHAAHGSNQAALLKVRDPRLCQSCHVGGGHSAQTYPITDRRAFNRSCVNCHFNIHGSNHPSGGLFLR